MSILCMRSSARRLTQVLALALLLAVAIAPLTAHAEESGTLPGGPLPDGPEIYRFSVAEGQHGGEPQPFLVTQRVVEIPPVLLTPGNISATVAQGDSVGDLHISADSDLSNLDSPLSFTAESDQSWLSVSPASGVATGQWHQEFTLSVTSSALALGSYDATVSVCLAGGEPKTCPVRLLVLQKPTISTSTANLHVKYGTKVTLKSSLKRADGTLLPGSRLALQRSYDRSAWTTVTAPVSLTGSYSVVVPVYRKTYFRWVFAGAGDLAPCTSATKLVESYALVTSPNVGSRLRLNHTYVFHGHLKPRHDAGSYAITVYWQCYYRGAWRATAELKVFVTNSDSYSKYAYGERYGRGVPRRWRVRARHSDTDHLKTYSAWKTYLVY